MSESKAVLIVKAVNYAGKTFYFPQEVYDRTATLLSWHNDDAPFAYDDISKLLLQLDVYNAVQSRLGLPEWSHLLVLGQGAGDVSKHSAFADTSA